MLSSIEFIPQFMAETRLYSAQDALISITDPDNNPPVFNNISYLLRIKFLDIETPIAHPNFNPDFMFQPFQAEQIKCFIDDLPTTVRHLVVHCFAGASRSAALALAISEYTGAELLKRESASGANLHVLNVCEKVFNLSTHIVVPEENRSSCSTIFTF